MSEDSFISKEGIELAKIVAALKKDLQAAQQLVDEEGAAIRFNVDSIDVELNTVVTADVSGSVDAGIKFYVVDAKAKLDGKYQSQQSQKITFRLTPKDANGGDLKINSTRKNRS